nr:hypothetical protein [Tanacetum cinerariifolium]
NGGGKVAGGQHNERPAQVGQQVDKDEPAGGQAQHPPRLDEGGRAQPQHLPAHYPRHIDPHGKAHGYEADPHAFAVKRQRNGNHQHNTRNAPNHRHQP